MKHLSLAFILFISLSFASCEDTKYTSESGEADTTATEDNLLESKSSGEVEHPEDGLKKKD